MIAFDEARIRANVPAALRAWPVGLLEIRHSSPQTYETADRSTHRKCSVLHRSLDLGHFRSGHFRMHGAHGDRRRGVCVQR